MLEAKDIKWNNAIVKVMAREDVVKHGLTLTLEPTLMLEVLVKDTEGNPLQGAKVWLSENWGSFPSSKSCTADALGIARFDRVFSGGVYWMPLAELEGYSHERSNDILIAGTKEWKDKIEVVMESL